MSKNFLTANNLNRIEGFIDREEGDRLAKYAAAVPAGSCIVEIGSASGSGALYLASGARKAETGVPVVCFDPYETAEDNAENYVASGVRELFEARARYVGLDFRAWPDRQMPADPDAWTAITLAVLPSLEGAAVWREFVEVWPPIGLLHIDGLHDYANARADFLAWAPLVARGGFVIMHDLNNPRGGWDVAGVVRDVVMPSGLVKEKARPKWSRYKGRRRGQWIGVKA